jgi:hypothetical protein
MPRWRNGARPGALHAAEETAMESVGFITRLFMGLLLPWKLLFDGRFAARVASLSGGAPADDGAGSSEKVAQLESEVSSLRERAEGAEKARDEVVAAADARDEHAPALHMLSILQRDGRLLDFLSEDVSSFSDAEVGAAARLVHDGCRKVVTEYLELVAVRDEEEGSSLTVDKGFDANEIRLVGNVTGEPPHKGTLAHGGWRAKTVKLPAVPDGHDPHILAPAEVEL